MPDMTYDRIRVVLHEFWKRKCRLHTVELVKTAGKEKNVHVQSTPPYSPSHTRKDRPACCACPEANFRLQAH
eukprot:453367-Pelagomonas_calceolata.AAC.6